MRSRLGGVVGALTKPVVELTLPMPREQISVIKELPFSLGRVIRQEFAVIFTLTL
jgi:hypothetical protein